MNEQELTEYIEKNNSSLAEVSSDILLSESLIRKFKDQVLWNDISFVQVLSESFIREFQDRVNWRIISLSTPLSEPFIREFRDRVNWYNISSNQILTGDFIGEFKDRVNWTEISSYQVLPENFIRKFEYYVDWWNISRFQTLSEPFIREFKDWVYWENIGRYQVLSDAFYDEFPDVLERPGENNWRNKDREFKRQKVSETGLYEMDGDDIIAYKTTKLSGRSLYRAVYRYAPGETYTSNADYNIDVENSFGLGAWTKEDALDFFRYGKLFKVKIHLDDLAALVYSNNKLRANRLTVIEEVNVR